MKKIEFGFDTNGNLVVSGMKKACEKYCLKMQEYVYARLLYKEIPVAMKDRRILWLKVNSAVKVEGALIGKNEGFPSDAHLFERDEVSVMVKNGEDYEVYEDLKFLNADYRTNGGATFQRKKEMEAQQIRKKINELETIGALKSIGRIGHLNTGMLAHKIASRGRI